MHSTQLPFGELISALADDLAVTVFHCRVDKDWTLDYLSQGYLALTGRQQWESLPGSPLAYANFLNRLEPEHVCAEARRVLQAHHTFTMQYDILTATGRRRVLERTRGVYDGHQRLEAVVGMVLDLEELISGEPLLGEPRSFLEPLLQHAPFPVYMVSRDDRMRLANPAFEGFVAQGKPCAGLRIQELFSPSDSVTFHSQNQRVLETLSPLSLTEPVQGQEGLHYFHTVKFPVWDALEGRYAIGGVSLDVTSLVEATEALETSRQSLSEALELREDFISIAAHELRTPLTSLSLRLRQLHKQLEKLSPSGPGAALSGPLATLSSCEEQGKRLTRMVDQLLDTVRIRTGRLELQREWMDLGALVRGVVARHEGELERAGCRVSFEERDPERHCAQLRMKDEGIGIALDMQPRIFERFERAVPSRSYGGLGLGLYICRQIIQAHGGTISVVSTPGQGSEFLVELPLAPPLH